MEGLERNQNKITTIEDGERYVLAFTSKEEAEGIINKIAVFFGEPEFLHKEIIDTVLGGQDYRFEGTFNLKLRKHGELFLDNRNASGVKENQEKLRALISFIL